jgi:hypothetical protein
MIYASWRSNSAPIGQAMADGKRLERVKGGHK